MKRTLFFLLGIILFNFSFAQERLVTGTVTDDNGESLPGVNVVIKGTTQGVVTNVDGNYQIEVNDFQSDVLLFSFIGFSQKEIQVRGNKSINVTLNTLITSLDEVVAVGYGTMRKRDITGAIVSVDGAELEKTPTYSVATALQGKVAGVRITANEGSPDSEIQIRVRGGGSITQSNDPLYVIDGFPSTDGIAMLDPNDIESIEVLKDASSAAIYGARGSNGVIIITTKRGFEGKTTINYDFHYGVRKLVNKMDVLNPHEFVELQYERADGGEEEILNFEKYYGPFNNKIVFNVLFKNPGWFY